MDEDDRISELPEHILHHKILSLLPQNLAVRTCILSKSWRHLGPTRPKIEFDEIDFPEGEEKFLSVVEKTLQRYDDQELSIQEFVLEIFNSDDESISLLNKWIPKVITNMGVKIFNLSASGFSLPSIVFQAEFLKELVLQGCSIKNCINVKLHVLKRLELLGVEIDNETFENIMSSCPSIQHLVVHSCSGLSSLKVNKAPNLKHINCHRNDSIEINDDAQTLETILIKICLNRFLLHNNKNNFFPRLKSLILNHVYLTTELLWSSNNCPCLEYLELQGCYGLTEMKLSNRSIKRLIINVHTLTKVAIDAANILCFNLWSGGHLPSIVSFATTTNSRECKSYIRLMGRSYSDSAWYPKLHESLKAISQSQIFLNISFLPHELTNQEIDCYDDGGISEPPVVVERLCLKAQHYSSSLLNCVFRICRPMYINLRLYSPLTGYEWKTLVCKGETTTQCHFGQQDLEETSIQVLDNKTNVYVWRDVHQVCEFPNNEEEIRLRLKWRDLNYN